MSKKGFASNCIKDDDFRPENEPTQIPLHATSSFSFRSMAEGMAIFKKSQEGHVYSRYGNPQVDAVAEKIARLELRDDYAPDCTVLTASGMSAIHCLLHSLLSPGNTILTQADLYGGTSDLLAEVFQPLGVHTITAPLDDADHLRQLIEDHPEIDLIYFETPTNPLLSVVSLEQIASIGRTYDIVTVCDNTFATPYLQTPFAFGIDYVIHSTTKYLNGHGNAIGGIVIGTEAGHMKEILKNKVLLGCQANPFDSWMLNQGLKTLPLRMERHSTNALKVARFLTDHPALKNVYYPGLESHAGHLIAREQMKQFGGVVSFELDGELNDAIRFADRLDFIRRAPTLGDVESLVLHPASMSHRNMPPAERAAHGISDSLVRISVGIEDVEDIIEDIERSLG